MGDDNDFSDYEIIDSDPIRSEEPSPRPRGEVPIWKAKLIFWGIIAGGVVILAALFVFFLTLLIYFFIPLLVIVGIWMLVRRFLSG